MADPEAAALWKDLRLGYAESQGLPLLRREIAALYEGLSADDVLVAVPEEAIFVAVNCLVEAGDHVVCTSPGYQSLYEIARAIGCEVSPWRPVEGAAGWRFDGDALEKLLTPRTKLLVVNFPHNPTGALLSAAEFERVVALARERGIHLFSDEMYRYLEADPADRLPAACTLYDKALSLFGMSKTFGLAGLRLGWLATKDAALLQRMLAFKDYTTICNAAPSEILALIGLRARERLVALHRERIAGNLDRLDAFFKRHAALFSWSRPKAGTVGFPGLRAEKDADAFCDAVMKGAQVMLLPSSVYGYSQPHVRVGFGRRNMPEALERLDRFLLNR